MFNKKSFLITILVFVTVLSAFSTVNATGDLNATDEALIDESDEPVLENADEDVVTSNPGSFTSLNSLINENTFKDIYLKSNYTFNINTDYDLYDGIEINREVTIHGNGFTVDGSKISRLFQVTGSNVIFENLIFVNGNTNSDGAAISGRCIVTNCTFIGNIANGNGGALYGGSAEDSTFINNVANWNGGAIADGYAFNCKFIGNRADYAFNSHGGAIYYGYAQDCVFINNSASWGGAMYAGINGGQYYNLAVDCIFEGNKAQFNGGALYECDALRCNFTKNSASQTAGAMYGGMALYCFYNDNSANSYPNTCSTQFLEATLDVSNFSSSYLSGDVLKVIVRDDEGIVINETQVTVRVYKDSNLVGTYNFLSGSGWSVNLDVGTYDAVFSIENQSCNAEPADAKISISKAPLKITASPVQAVYNVDNYLVIHLMNSQNMPISDVELSVNFNGVKTFKTDKNGQIRILVSNLIPKKYDVTVTFNGNDKYLKTSAVSSVTVKKANVKLTAKAKKFKAKAKTKKYSVTLKDNTGKAMKNVKLTLKVKSKTYKAKTNSKGVATFKLKLKKGKITAKVKYGGNNYYNALIKKVKITVN